MFWLIKLIIYIILIVNRINKTYSKKEYCPKVCICDLYQSFNRADCSDQKLIDAQIEISKYVEVLDLSSNAITSLNDDSFTELKFLISLSLDRNSLETISLNAITPMRKLETLILSYNRLEVFDNRIIEQNTKLIKLDLSGNKFMNLELKPMLISRSVSEIYLSESQVTHIFSVIFEELPNLRTIDLTNNLLITLNITPFLRHHKLRELNLNDNNIKCDKNMQDTLKKFKRRRVNVTMTNCLITKSKHMFERMEMLPTESIKTTEKPNVDVELVWQMTSIKKLFYQICSKNLTNTSSCNTFEKCMLNFTTIYYNETSLVKPPINRSTIFNELHPFRVWRKTMANPTSNFILGFILGGLIIGTVVHLIHVFTQKCCRKKDEEIIRPQFKQDRIRSINNPEVGQRISNTEATSSAEHLNLSTSTPSPILIHLDRTISSTDVNVPMTRRQQRALRRQRRQQLQEQRGNSIQNETVSFFSGLFQRRRHYYRTINQNATNLVRRLSQSRLFLNATARQTSTVQQQQQQQQQREQLSSQQQRSTTTESNDLTHAYHNHDTIRLINNRNISDDIHLVQHLSQSLPSLRSSTLNFGLPTSSTDNINARSLSILRSETPPPAYGDVIDINHNTADEIT